MFGYIKVDKPNILIKDFNTYKAYYCGLCKSIGKHAGELMRLGVNYDIAFLSILAHNYEDLQPEFDMQRCFIHPIGPKFSVVLNDSVQERIVDINTILGYYKVYDDLSDKGGVKHLAAKNILKPYYKKAAKRLPELDAALKKCFAELHELESAGSRDVDKLSKTSADMLVAVGLAACKNPDEHLVALCADLGRWIYEIDAFDDLKKDVEKGCFNPFADHPVEGEELEKLRQFVSDRLFGYIKNIRAAYDKMRITVSEGPLSNIIYLGLRARTEEVLKSGGIKCKKTLL